MSTYRRIEYEDRCQIHALREAGKTPAAIGKALGFSQGTVSRELSRHQGRRGYRCTQAQRHAQSRQEPVRHKPRKLTIRVRRAMARKLREDRWSPEQIRFWLRDERGVQLSHAWIDRMVWDNKHAGGALWRSLRRRGKHDNRRGAQHAGRGVSPDRIDRAERPAVVHRTARLGDWEGDPLVGARHQGALLTHVERKSLFPTLSTLTRPTAKAAHRATVHRLKPWRDNVHTITDDHGKAFAGHRHTAHILPAQVFFATPSHAWERGVNEKTNGLIRDCFPTGTDCSTIHPATGAQVERLLNRRPRKSLGFNTPTEAFHALAKRG